MAKLTRSAVADYLNVGTTLNKRWALCGTGFNSLNESPNAQSESKVYIHEDESTSTVLRYESSFDFDIDTWNDQEAVMKIYNIARNRLVGTNATVEYLRTDFKIEADGTPITTVVPARLFTCSVEVSNIQGNGGETLTMSGNLNVCGKFTEGTFDLVKRTWTEGGTVGAKTVESLTVTISAGGAVSVSPALATGHSYVYKIEDAEPTAPDYNELLNEGWKAWDGESAIEVESGKYLGIAEVSNAGYCKGFGSVAA